MTGIIDRLKVMHETGRPLILTATELFEYWESIPVPVRIHYLKELSETKYGIVFRGERISVYEPKVSEKEL